MVFDSQGNSDVEGRRLIRGDARYAAVGGSSRHRPAFTHPTADFNLVRRETPSSVAIRTTQTCKMLACHLRVSLARPRNRRRRSFDAACLSAVHRDGPVLVGAVSKSIY